MAALASECAEGITLAAQPAYGTRQCPQHIVASLERVMEDDNRSTADIAAHILQDIPRLHASAVVARDHVVHDDIVAAFERRSLTPAHDAVRRPEQRRAYQGVSLGNIAQIAAARCVTPLQVVHGVVAYGVSAAAHFVKQLGIAPHVVAHHKKGGLDTLGIEDVKHLRSHLRDGPVVKGQIDGGGAGAVDTPYGLRK